MILYTILSEEDIFYSAPPTRTLRQEGNRFFEESNGCLCRLISTDPADYLNAAYSPGRPGLAVFHTDSQ